METTCADVYCLLVDERLVSKTAESMSALHVKTTVGKPEGTATLFQYSQTVGPGC